MAKCICDSAGVHSSRFTIDWKRQTGVRVLNDHGRGVWCEQMMVHMLSLLAERSAMRSEGRAGAAQSSQPPTGRLSNSVVGVSDD